MTRESLWIAVANAIDGNKEFCSDTTKKVMKLFDCFINDQIPTSWLDPLLTGKDAVIGRPPYECPDIERLLKALQKRMTTSA